MRLEQATTRLQANNQLLNSRLDETNVLTEDLRKKAELLELALSKEKKRVAEFEALKLAHSDSPRKRSRSKGKSGNIPKSKSSGGYAKISANKARSGKAIKVKLNAEGDAKSEADTEIHDDEVDDTISIVSRDGAFSAEKPGDSGVADGGSPTVSDQLTREKKERETELTNLRRENATLANKIQWFEERLKNSTESSNIVTETLNDLHAKYKAQSKKLSDAEKEVSDLHVVLNQERNEKHMEIAMVKDQMDAQRLMEVESLQNELNAILSDRTQLSRDEVVKLMKSRADMEKQLHKEKLEKRKEAQVLLHQQGKLKKQVMMLRQDLKDNDKMWMKKFNALQHSYHAIREEYHLREALRRQFNATQKIDIVRNGSSNMSKSVIQQQAIVPTNLTLGGNQKSSFKSASTVSSVDESHSTNTRRYSKGSGNVLGSSNETGDMDDYSDDEFHAEYSYLSLIKEVAEPSDVSSREAQVEATIQNADMNADNNNIVEKANAEEEIGEATVDSIDAGDVANSSEYAMIASQVESSYVTGESTTDVAKVTDQHLAQMLLDQTILDGEMDSMFIYDDDDDVDDADGCVQENTVND